MGVPDYITHARGYSEQPAPASGYQGMSCLLLGGRAAIRSTPGPLAALALLGNSQLRIGYSVIQSYSKAAAAVLRDPRSQRVPRIKDLHACVTFFARSSSVLTIFSVSFEQDLQSSTKQTGVVTHQGSARQHVALHTC